MIRVRSVTTGVAGAPWYTNLYFDGVEGSTEAQAAVDVVRDFWLKMAPSINTPLSTTVDGQVVNYDPATGDVDGFFSVISRTVVGTGGSQMLPLAAQGLIRLRTNDIVGNRFLQGRIFVPGLTESNNTSVGTPDGPLIDLMEEAAELLINAAPTFVVWSRPQPARTTPTGPKPARAGSVGDVTQAQGWNKWAVLRSRRD